MLKIPTVKVLIPKVATPPKSEIVSKMHKTVPAIIEGLREGRSTR
tara:strand:+ start:262 stop:396 length:135 start_codon:yes stop_codon:yes gene_type:complete